MIASRVLSRLTVAALLATLLAGCGASFSGTTYDPRRACESFGASSPSSGSSINARTRTLLRSAISASKSPT